MDNFLYNYFGYNKDYVLNKNASLIQKIYKNYKNYKIKKTQDYIIPDNRYKNQEENSAVLSKFKFLNPETNYKSVSCVACSPQANVTKPATTILSKKY